MSEHRLRRRVQFHETDAAGIAHFSSYFKYMEEAEHALWRAAGLSISPAGAVIGWPRVAASFDFHRPLRFEDEFEVLIRIAAITEKSLKYSCVITKDDMKMASGAMTVTCVRKGSQPLRAISIPAEIAARFKAALEGSEQP